jgi:hypothetical protein
MRARTLSKRLRQDATDRILWTRQWTFGFYKRWGISWAANRLKNCSMKPVTSCRRCSTRFCCPPASELPPCNTTCLFFTFLSGMDLYLRYINVKKHKIKKNLCYTFLLLLLSGMNPILSDKDCVLVIIRLLHNRHVPDPGHHCFWKTKHWSPAKWKLVEN